MMNTSKLIYFCNT